MLIKRFEAETPQDALAAVRETLGPDALILSTKSVRRRRGAFGLLAKTVVEVTAASQRQAPAEPEASHTGRDASWKSLEVSRAVVAPLEREIHALRSWLEQAEFGRTPPPSLGQEIAELRRLTRAMVARVPEASADRSSAHFRAAGIAEGFAALLGQDAEARIDTGEVAEEARIAALAARLEGKLAAPRPEAGHTLVVGAPGVGKTTTVGKWAGHNANADTRVVTTDAHRHGGVASLKGIAKALGVRLDVATSPDSLARIAEKRGGRLVVDTPGQGRDDRESLAELSHQRAALGEHASVQLVLSAGTQEADLRQQLARYAFLRPEAVVVSKLDDSAALGGLVNVLLEPDTPPVSWVGTGQRIPDHFVPPDAFALARQVLHTCP
ncbi:MAG: hypothetical protein AAF430_02950 [Myxococcota bacterium]